MTFYPNADHVVSFLHVFTSLVKWTSSQTIKHKYDPPYLEFKMSQNTYDFSSPPPLTFCGKIVAKYGMPGLPK